MHGRPDVTASGAAPGSPRGRRKPRCDPSSSSMRSSWLYLQTRSVRLADPVLIWPAAVPTARSAIVASSVSPERCEMIVA